MLVLTRKRSEVVRIGDGVTITVCAIHGDKVRLAIEAPKDVSIHREEVYQRIQGEKSDGTTPT